MSFVALNWLGTATVAEAGIWPFSPYGIVVTGYNTPWLISQEALMTYFLMWGIFTFAMFFGTLKTNRALQFVFISLAILFFMLTIRSAVSASFPAVSADVIGMFTRIIGAEGIICGASAVYLALAEILNEAHEKTVLPICPVS
jgi:succinate-acetate transporter protein